MNIIVKTVKVNVSCHEHTKASPSRVWLARSSQVSLLEAVRQKILKLFIVDFQESALHVDISVTLLAELSEQMLDTALNDTSLGCIARQVAAHCVGLHSDEVK